MAEPDVWEALFLVWIALGLCHFAWFGIKSWEFYSGWSSTESENEARALARKWARVALLAPVWPVIWAVWLLTPIYIIVRLAFEREKK